MDKFLETYNLPRLNQENIHSLNRVATSIKIELVIKKLPANKCPELISFMGEFYQTYNKVLIPILLKLFQKIEEEGTLPNSLQEAKITLIPKPEKDTTKKRKLLANISDEYRCKNPQQNSSKPNSTIYKKDHTP